MNQSNRNPSQLSKFIIFTVFFSVFSFVALFTLLSFFLYRIPNFENYYDLFPYVLLGIECGVLVLFCKRFRGKSALFALLSAVTVSSLSFLLGVIFHFDQVLILPLLARHLVFILLTVLFQILMNKSTPKNRKSKLPFKK